MMAVVRRRRLAPRPAATQFCSQVLQPLRSERELGAQLTN